MPDEPDGVDEPESEAETAGRYALRGALSTTLHQIAWGWMRGMAMHALRDGGEFPTAFDGYLLMFMATNCLLGRMVLEDLPELGFDQETVRRRVAQVFRLEMPPPQAAGLDAPRPK